MTSQITTLTKDGTIKLPTKVQRRLRGSKVSMHIYGYGDTVLIKRIAPTLSFGEMMHEMRKAAKRAGITRKDVDNAIRAARKDIRRLRTSEFWTTWQSLKNVRGKISQRDIDAAVKRVRRRA